jgi:hypothetical protein
MMPEIRDDERHVPVLFSSSLSQKEFLFLFFFFQIPGHPDLLAVR